MMRDALRGYLQVATGLTELTRQRAVEVARGLLSQSSAAVEQVAPGPVREQVQTLAEDLVATSKANRDLLLGLIRAEVERTVARLGLATVDDVERLARTVDRLERRLAATETPGAKPVPKRAAKTATAPRQGGRTAAAPAGKRQVAKRPPAAARPRGSAAGGA